MDERTRGWNVRIKKVCLGILKQIKRHAGRLIKVEFCVIFKFLFILYMLLTAV